MKLCKDNLPHIDSQEVIVPDEELLQLPEKVLQFGTGVLLRALPDYYIDEANRQGVFNGRVVVVKSTTTGDTKEFVEQDCLYTICVRSAAKTNDATIICSSISRVINANEKWNDVLACAENKDLKIIISNTTEAGLQYEQELLTEQMPHSFPAKLLAFLYKRYQYFNGSDESGMVIIPTELITDNGKVLKSIIIKLAELNRLSDDFIDWLKQQNDFCSSLVDRIVPGKPGNDFKEEVEAVLGYEDSLMTVAEAYNLWAIEGNSRVEAILSFASVNKNLFIKDDITEFRELKLRLLNGTHTISCGVCFFSGVDTVGDAMNNLLTGKYISDVMLNEIAVAMPLPIEKEKCIAFAEEVLDRFRNPYIFHHWINITLQYSLKMRMRVVPVLLKFYESYGKVPELIALGFAAYIRFMRSVKFEKGKYYGEFNGNMYLINDDKAALFFEWWKDGDPASVIHKVLNAEELWGTKLSIIKNFEDIIKDKLHLLTTFGSSNVLKEKFA